MFSNVSNPEYELVVVSSTEFCDGIPDCNVNFEDEHSPMCSDRFSCDSGERISIAADEECDGTIDCDNETDETPETCSEQFFCSSLGGTKVIGGTNF